MSSEFFLPQEERAIVAEVRRFVDREVVPAASALEQRDEFPEQLVEQMKALGLFALTIPEAYGGLGLHFTTYTAVVEELCRGWMSLGGILNTHVIVAHLLQHHGTPEQRGRFLPPMSRGERRAALCMTEPGAGSDVQAIITSALRQGDHYLLNGTKLFITNGRRAGVYAVLTKTDRTADPPYRGISLFLVEPGTSGFSVGRDIGKLGYRGVETCELRFEDAPVPAANLLGAQEGQGFHQVMEGLEVGRLNVAARAVGVARAAFEAAIRYAQQRHTFGKPIAEHQAIQFKLADMATQIQAARLLTLAAAAKKDLGERSDLEAGMAKLFASEIALTVTLEALRVHGGYGYTTDLPLERYYRDAPLMAVAEGTNEIQRLVIARHLLRLYAV